MDGSSSTMAMARAMRFSLLLRPRHRRRRSASVRQAAVTRNPFARPARVLPQIARFPPLTRPTGGGAPAPNVRQSILLPWMTTVGYPRAGAGDAPATDTGGRPARWTPHAKFEAFASWLIPLLVGRGLGAKAPRPLAICCARP